MLLDDIVIMHMVIYWSIIILNMYIIVITYTITIIVYGIIIPILSTCMHSYCIDIGKVLVLCYLDIG